MCLSFFAPSFEPPRRERYNNMREENHRKFYNFVENHPYSLKLKVPADFSSIFLFFGYFTMKFWIDLVKDMIGLGHHVETGESLQLEKQTEKSRQKDTIWSCIHKGDVEGAVKLFKANPEAMYEVGPVGELPLHLCFLYNGHEQLAIAWKMIERDPKLITEVYKGTEYTGENVLHIAIIKQNFESLSRLIKVEPALAKAGATGKFFQEGKPCYYGEYPLAFASCTNQVDMIECLLENGADIDQADSNGNTILHLLVIHSLPEIYVLIKNKWKDLHGGKAGITPLWLRRNKEGYTPFTLCAHLGIKDMFDFLLEEGKQIQWSYGPVTCMLYPLDELDWAQRGDDSCSSSPSALELIINEAHMDLLMNPRIVDLIQRK